MTTSFVKTEAEESDDFRFSFELAEEEQKMEQAPLGSKAMIIGSITFETLSDGEAVTDSGQFVRPMNRYTPDEHKQRKQHLRQHYLDRTKRMDGQDQLPVAQRFAAPEELETQKKRVQGFFLKDATERPPGLTKQTSSRRFLSRDSLSSSGQRPILTRSKSEIMEEGMADVEERKITRSELEEIFLERTGALVSEDRINHIFLKADTEGTGFVKANDVAAYITSIEPRKQRERKNCIYRSIMISISFWCVILFVVGAIANIITNLRQREYGDLHGDKSHSCWQIGAWAFQIGCLGLLFRDYDFERITFERLQLINQKLVRWIRRDLPLIYAESVPCNIYLEMATDLTGIIVEQDSKVQSNSRVLSDVAGHNLMNLQQLRLVLENAGVVLSYEDLIRVFTEIAGDDRKEYITMLHLTKFAEKKQKLLEGKAKHRAILRRCLKSPGFWADFLFCVASAAYVLLDWVDATNEMAAIGAIGYFLGATGGIFDTYKSLSRSLYSMERVNVRLRAAAVKLGMLVTVKDEEESNSIRISAIVGVKESQISWLSEAELRKLQKVGARRLFGLVGMDDEEIISDMQLYRALMDLGVYVSIASCKQLYAKIALEEQVQVSDIVYYIERIRSNGYSTSRIRRVYKVVTAMPWDFSFWFRILTIGAAVFGILGTWTSSAIIGSNMFLASSFCWFAVASYNVHVGYKSKAASFDQEEESGLLLKQSILEATAEDNEKREEICLASKILASLRDKDHTVPLALEPQLRRTSSTLTSLKHLAAFSQSAILGLIMNREGSSSFMGREAPQSHADEEKKETSSETESYDSS